MEKNRKCPIFKRRSFFQDYNVVLDATLGQGARELYEYLRDNQLYDVDMIWENILRTCHQ
ncbi:rhamnan synthesis F family protein, partial [Lacrimispora saccharolytica]|nr:rhamnan synthesis F family protein [Lacrimispora saccharolytica]